MPSTQVVKSNEIANLLCSRLGLEIPSSDTDLFDAGILDSMGFVELLLQLESNFGIRLSLSEIEFENFRSVDRIAEFVTSRAISQSVNSGEQLRGKATTA